MRGELHNMTLITPDVDVSEMQELLASVTETVRAFRRDLETLSKRVNAGEEVNATQVKSVASQMTAQLGLCQKLESNLAECRRRQSGIAPGADHALDLEQARFEIGCKLDNLRACCGAVPLPE